MNRYIRNKVVYAWVANDEIFYIGIGSFNRSKSKRSRNPYCLNKRNKAEREEVFEIRILATDLTFEEACQREIELIKQYGRIDNGTGCLTNMTNGGEFNDYWRDKTFNESHRNNISNSCKGKTLSIQHKKNIGKSHKGKKHSLETRKKISRSKSNSDVEKWEEKDWRIKEKYKSKMLSVEEANLLRKTIPVQTPLGVFDSYQTAAMAFELNEKKMYRKCKSSIEEDFFFLY